MSILSKKDLCQGRNHASTVNTAFFGAFVWRPSICPQRTQTLARNGSTMGGGHEQPIEGRLLLNVDLQPKDKWKSGSGIVVGGLRILQREEGPQIATQNLKVENLSELGYHLQWLQPVFESHSMLWSPTGYFPESTLIQWFPARAARHTLANCQTLVVWLGWSSCYQGRWDEFR